MIDTRRNILLGAATALAGIALSTEAKAASAAQITADSIRALGLLYTARPKAKMLGEKAKAVLVFPDILKAGLIVGGQSGNGALLKNGKALGFYNISAASFGLQAGAQTFSYALFFMNDKALKYLDKSDGWSIGTGPTVVVADEGMAASLTSTTLSQDVYAFPFGQKGLMAGIGLEGSKITHIHPDK